MVVLLFHAGLPFNPIYKQYSTTQGTKLPVSLSLQSPYPHIHMHKPTEMPLLAIRGTGNQGRNNTPNPTDGWENSGFRNVVINRPS